MIYTLELTQEQLNIISIALGEIPFKIVAPLVENINKQLIEQQAKKEE